MEPHTTNDYRQLEAKIDAIYESVEKTRKYFLFVLWATLAMMILPAIGLLFAIPTFIEVYTSTLEGVI